MLQRFSRCALCLLAALMPLLGLSACSHVVVQGAQLQRDWYPGLLVLKVQPGEAGVRVVRLRSLGVNLGWSASTLGWVDESLVLLDRADDCRILIVVRNETERRALLDDLRDRPPQPTLCVIDPHPQESAP